MNPLDTRGRFRAAFFGALSLALSLAALPARGQTPENFTATPAPAGQSPSPTPTPTDSATPGPKPSLVAVPTPLPTAPGAPFAGENPPTAPSVQPLIAPAPGTTPTPAPTPTAPGSSPTPKPSKIQTRSDEAVNRRSEGLSILRGNVHVTYGDVRVDAEEINVDQNKHEISTDTKFTINQPDPKSPGQRQIVSGTGLRYNYETDESTVYNANVSTPAEYPGQQIYIRAKKVTGIGQSRFDATDATFTTCDELLKEDVPHYHVECKSLQYFAGDRIVAWDDKIYVNGKYVAWLPVAVIPLKQDGVNLDVGRNDIEGFYLRYSYPYALPALANGYWLNNGKLVANLFEKKGVGLGFEHTVNWGYAATTYAYFYGLLSPDKSSFLWTNDTDDQAVQDADVKRGEALFGLYGGPFQDHQAGIEHRQRLIGNMEAGGRFQDDNIYDPLTPNFRVNRRILRADLKDNISALGVTYSLGYDSTDQRGTQTRTGSTQNTTINQSANDSLSQRVNGQVSTRILNTNLTVNTDYQRQHQSTLNLPAAAFATPSPDLSSLAVTTKDGGGNVNVSTNLNATSNWPGNVNSTFSLPYRITYQETPTPESPSPGATPTPAGGLIAPSPTPVPWNQNIEPDLDVNTHIASVGTLDAHASKFFDLTKITATPPPTAGLSVADRTAANTATQAAIRAQSRWERLPEISLTSDPFFANWQPVSLMLDYGRFFEYATFKIPGITKDGNNLANYTGIPDRYFPGPFTDRINPQFTLGSKAQDLGFRSQMDFGGSGYRQFFYSTGDEQYSIDEHARLTTNWTDKIQSNVSYTNNLTPDLLDFNGGGPGTATNNSPFNQDKLSTYKQTHVTADFNIHQDPFLTYALRGGYDYQNKAYDNFSSDVSWRSVLPGLGFPLGLSLNGQFQPLKITEGKDIGGLKLLSKPLDIRYLPKVPLYGVDGTWLPVTGTFTLRSTPNLFGGAFGSDAILSGWQLDNQLAYDFNLGLWQSLNNRLYIIMGDKWQNHIEFMLGGYYDITPAHPGYHFSTFGVSKDLHDFILSFQYDQINSYYSLSLTMVAFPSKPVNFTSNSFNRTLGTSGTGIN